MTNQQIPHSPTQDIPGDERLRSAVEDICWFVVKLKDGKESDDQIQKRLTDAGLSGEDARNVTQLGLARVGKDRSAGLKDLLIGALLLAAGLAALAAGVQWLAYAGILLGLFQLLVGLLKLWRAPRGKADVLRAVERIMPAIKIDDTSRWKIAAIKIHNP